MLRKLLLCLLFMLSLAVLLAYDVRAQFAMPLSLPEKVVYEIPAGGHLTAVIDDLRAKGYFRSARLPLYLRAYARIRPVAAAIKAGEYELMPGMTLDEVLQLFVSGKVFLHSLQIVEGWSFEQALATMLSSAELVHTLGDGATGETVMAALGYAEIAPEGRFFPDTYRFPKGTTDAAFLRRAYASMEAVLQQEWAQRAVDLPYRTADEALVMASIIEKETGVPDERALIAGVFVNRLRIGMRLQTDPTVIYGLGKGFDGNLRRVDLLNDTPFNTYTRTGLPPTPICLPGRASIHAALHPADTQALYFVSRGDGTHIFSDSLEAHNAAVDQFQRKRNATQ